MYAAIREYKLQSGKINELIPRIRDEFVPLLANAPGFVGYTVVQVGGDDIVTTSVFENKAGAEESVKAAAGWVKDTVAALTSGPPRVTTGEMMIRHVKEGVHAGYGVLRRFELGRADAEQVAQRVRDGLVPILNGMPGFASYGLLMESGEDRGATLAAYLDRNSAEAAFARASKWVDENLAGISFKPLDVIAGDIKVRQMRAMENVR